MMLRRYRWLLCVLTIVDVAGAESPRIAGATMGTTYHVKLASPPAPDVLVRLEAEVAATLRDVDERMSTYRPDSEVCRFNRAGAGDWFAVAPSTAEVVAAALEVSDKSGGALDVTVGPLVRLWHFGPGNGVRTIFKNRSDPFVPEQLAKVRRTVGWRKLDVRVEPPALRKDVDTLEIDLSAVAKGYAVDRVAVLLAGHGFTDFIVEVGGEIRAAGRRGDGRPWRVAVERPLPDRRELLSTIPLTDAAMATSGDYRNFFERGGRRYSHIIDPSTGRPVQHSLASTTVVADTCLAADAWATALLVLGPEHGLHLAKQHQIAALLISHEAGRDDVIHTPAWRTRLAEETDLRLDDSE